MRRKIGILRMVLLLVVIIIAGGLYYINMEPEKGFIVDEWDNIYNENNINFYYEDVLAEKKDEKIISLDSTFKVNEILSEENEEIEKVLKTVKIVNTICEYDNVSSTNLGNGYDILEKIKERRKVSGRDMAIIERDLLITGGYYSRICEFRKSNSQFEKNPSYYVVEYYSEKYKKWVMIDFKEELYITNEGIPISAIEYLNLDIEKLSYVGIEDSKEYIKNIKPYLKSLTVQIDNTVIQSKSNSCVTYFTDEKCIEIKRNGVFLQPSIFTNNSETFSVMPNIKAEKVDNKAYIVLMKKTKDEDSEEKFTIAAFKDSKVINNYYLKINDESFELIKDIYCEDEFEMGKNTIEVSLDGKTVLSKIVIDRQE